MGLFDGIGKLVGSVTSSTAGGILDSVVKGANDLFNTNADKEKAAEFAANMKVHVQAALDAHNEQMQKLADQQSAAQLADVSNARDMQIEALKQQSWFAKNSVYLLAVFVTVGFFGLLIYMCKWDVPAANKDMLNIMLGALGSAWVSIVGYFYGSSKSDTDKNEVIKNLSN